VQKCDPLDRLVADQGVLAQAERPSFAANRCELELQTSRGFSSAPYSGLFLLRAEQRPH